MTLEWSVNASQRASMRGCLLWFAKQKPLLSPEQQKAEFEHFAKDGAATRRWRNSRRGLRSMNG